MAEKHSKALKSYFVKKIRHSDLQRCLPMWNSHLGTLED